MAKKQFYRILANNALNNLQVNAERRNRAASILLKQGHHTEVTLEQGHFAVEIAIKAVLTRHLVEYDWIHSLSELAELKFNTESIKTLLDKSDCLGDYTSIISIFRFKTRYRYDEKCPLKDEEIPSATETFLRVYQWIKQNVIQS